MLNFQEPYIINVNDLQEDYIFPNAIDCAYYLEMYKFMETIENLERFTKNKNYIKHLSDLNNKLFDNKENMFLTFTKFRDDMVARQVIIDYLSRSKLTVLTKRMIFILRFMVYLYLKNLKKSTRNLIILHQKSSVT